jgi:quercetin dioxygenase-like cupin family protein
MSTTAAGADQGTLSPAGEGPTFSVLGMNLCVKSHGTENGGALDVFEQTVSPGSGVPPHRHRSYDEAIYVLEGELQCQVGDRTVNASTGAFAYAPRGVLHAFQNAGQAPAKALVWQMPASKIRPFLEQLREALRHLPPGPPDLNALAPLLQKYDLEPVGPAAGQ